MESREITISWQIQDSTTDIHEVTAEFRYKPIHPYTSGEEQHGHTDRASFTCKGLQPGTKYYIKGFFSGIYMHEQLEKVYEIECRTGEEAPPSVHLHNYSLTHSRRVYRNHAITVSQRLVTKLSPHERSSEFYLLSDATYFQEPIRLSTYRFDCMLIFSYKNK